MPRLRFSSSLLLCTFALSGCGSSDAPAATSAAGAAAGAASTGGSGTGATGGGGAANGGASAAGGKSVGGGTGTGGKSTGGAPSTGGAGAGGTSGGAQAGGMSAGGTSAGGIGGAAGGQAGGAGASGNANHIQTVWLIMMENHNWKDIKGSKSAPYINNTILTQGAHAEAYKNPPGNHPSEPNYLWLEAGTNFGIFDDNAPATNHQASTMHLATLLKNANVSWKAYQEDITAGTCPLKSVKSYAPKHDPFVFFDDSTGNLDPKDPYCIAHNVPYSTFEGELSAPPRYNFVTPNLCNDMHDSCAPTSDPIKQGDTWLSTEVPKIMASDAYKNGGAIFITWDESEGGEFPIGMMVLSPFAKPGGYSNTIPYTHSSTLRTMQVIFGVSPMLGDAANATDLGDLFAQFP